MADKETEIINALTRVAEKLDVLAGTADTTSTKIGKSNKKAADELNKLEASFKMAGKAVEGLAEGMLSTAKAMYKGEQGMSANAGAVDGLVKSVTAAAAIIGFLVPPFRLLSLAVIGLTKLLGTYAKETAKQSDDIYKAFQGLSRAGAVGADGMQGLYTDMKKLGLGVQDLDKMVTLVSANSNSLALFGGTVNRGRKQFADASGALDKYKVSLFNMGMTQDEINESMAGYIRLQSAVGETQKKTAQEVAESTYKYIQEQDTLTKLTGMTRKEQEAAREAALSEERFAAKLEQLRQQGRHDEAKALMDTNLMLASQSKEAAQGFRDISTGNLQTEASQKSMRATQGESMRVAQQISAGQLTAAEGADKVAAAHARNVTQMGVTQGLLGNYGKNYTEMAGDIRLRSKMLAGGFAEMQKEIDADRNKPVDPEIQRQSEMRKAQQKAMQDTQDFVRYGVEPATSALKRLSDVVTKLISYLPGVGKTPIGKEEPEAAGGTAGGGAGEGGGALSGAKTGAVTGALAGAKFGPKGIIIGGLLGGLVGGVAGAITGAGSATAPPSGGGAAPPATPNPQPLPGSHTQESRPAATPSAAATDPLTQVQQAGLRIRPTGDVYQGGLMTQSALGVARAIQDSVPNFGMFTGLNDQYHQRVHPRSAHAQGRGIDFTLSRMPTVEEAKAIKLQIQKIPGVSLVANEYFKPPDGDMNQYTTGPHFHAQTSAEKGGVFDGPNAGYPAVLHGQEAVIPLQNNAGNFVKLFEDMSNDSKQMLTMMSELVRSTKNSVDVQQKILIMQS